MTKSKALTFRPSNKKRRRKHGFRKRKLSRAGHAVLKRRMRKGRRRLVPEYN